nr:protein ITPRID2 isoform X2 [Nothobranchius furzeri]
MESSLSTVKRRAWINSCRQWSTLEDADGLLNLPSASVADDDVFSDGGFTGKIENWLLDCGSDVCPENSHQLSFASIVYGSHVPPEAGKQLSRFSSSTPCQRLCPPSLNLGHSMASSCLSTFSRKTVSSVSEVLELCSEDAEETLYELGFGSEEPQVTVRIPPRFLTFPSQAQGINFRLFLDAQIRRIREEDPSLSLASRFRQVQVLTAMANAFYSLYSHVSRTPLQKLETPECHISSPMERIERFRTSIRSEPRSPVERLKDTVNKMCLYTGSPRGSESTSPQPSPKKRPSLSEFGDVALKTKTGFKLDLEELDRGGSVVDFKQITDGRKLEEAQQIVADAGNNQKDTDICRVKMLGSKQTDNAIGGKCVRQTDLKKVSQHVRTSLESSLSGETVIETDHLLPSRLQDQDSCLDQSKTRTAKINPVDKVTCDLICPQIIESVHPVPFCCQNTHDTESLLHITSVGESSDTTFPDSPKLHTHTLISEPSGTPSQVDASRSLPVLEPDGSCAHYCITVTSTEGEDVSLSSVNTADIHSTSPFSSRQTSDESFDERERWYLNPTAHRGLDKFSRNQRQVNSFELEEVHSAGEDDVGQLEAISTASSPSFKKDSHKGEVVRGDSVQSDSSGYADEEVCSLTERHNR